MARAKTITKLPLDRWAEIIGIHPFHFNSMESDTYLDRETVCGMVWFQYAWQNADRISREEIAQAIRSAEDDIEGYVGYHLLPDWEVSERIRLDRPGIKELYSYDARNVRWQRSSVQTRFGHVISGGQKTKVGIATVDVTRSDEDSDGYSETVTVSVGTSVEDADEIKLFYSGKSGADEYEIRPITVTLDTDADTATITCKSWQIIDPDAQEDISPSAIDADVAGNYASTLDVYRVYNNPQSQVQFLWELDDTYYSCCSSATCTACQLGTQTGCLHNRNPRLGIVVPAPAEWSTSNGNFVKKEFTGCRGPDQIRLWYYSGNRDMKLSRPESEMEHYWELAVAYLAAAKLQKTSCGCGNVATFIEYWQEVREYSSRETGTYFQTQSQLTNPFGSTNGAKYAFEACNRQGRKLGR